MSDGFQVAASAFAVAELARQTAVLIHKICKARKDALGLYEKTRSLANLVETVHQTLRRRQNQSSSRSSSETLEFEQSVDAVLKLCKTCVSNMHQTFASLLDRSQSNMQLMARIRFIFKQNYIATQERDIGLYLSVLSVLLQCLRQEDHYDWQTQSRRMQQSMQDLQKMHEDFIQQLFAFFEYLFRAAAPHTAGSQRPTTHSHAFEVNPREVLAIENNDAPTLDDLFGIPSTRQSSLNNFNFLSGRRIEDVTDEGEQSLIPVGMVDELRATAEELTHIEPVDEQEIGMERIQTADVVQDSSQITLLLAIKSNQISLTQNLIANGTDLNWKDSRGWTFLHHAIHGLHEEIALILLDEPAFRDPDMLNVQTKTRETALIYAVQRVHKPSGYRIAMKLLTLDCDVNISDGKGSALYYAVKEGNPSAKPRRTLVERLAGRGAHIWPVYKEIPEHVENYDVLVNMMKATEDQANPNATSRQQGVSSTPPDRRDSTASRDGTRRGGRRWSISRRFSRTNRRDSYEAET